MKISARSPLLWTSATILSGLLYFFAFHFFPQTFPLINLSITMDLEQALDKADELALQYNFLPNDYQSAAMFNTDNTVKTFVELEARGKDAFVSMMNEQLYMPYTWRVRHFKEHEKNETTIIFTPDGTPYGFIETLSENIPGAQLTENDARIIAEDNAVTHWNIDFTHYKLVEASQKRETSGRLDHTFTYERTDNKISPPAEALANAGNQGLYRLKIVISGDKMTELTHFVKVPEAFNRRYAEMRSANNIITWIALLIAGLLYIFGCCGYGLFYLIKHHWNIIKQPFLWALFLSLLTVLVSINQLPFLWMQYSTAFSSNGFLMQIFLRLFIIFLAYTAFLTLVITTAEGLTRRAFGHHPQLWSVLQPNINTSYAILGRTIGGYLLVGLNCAFVMAFYLFSTKYLGWWSPSETLFDPNILATYVPWFSPIAQSLNAGFLEECLFRAIPLASAALLGNYFGKKNWWIAIAFILQAIVFGAAHANYPMQPSYARLIELITPSFIWGALYMRWGLITTIVAHSVYDIIWLSLPIFVSQTPHAFIYKITIIFITLLPIIYLLYARIRKGKWTTLPQSALNSSWQSSYAKATADKPIFVPQRTSHTFNPTTQKIMLVLGVAGFILWLFTTPFTHDGITISVDRQHAIEKANTFLVEKKFIPTAPWQTLPLMFTHYKLIPQIALQHEFIWKEGKKELYHQLLGTYLHPAHWTIRYAQFDTDIIQRTEEYKIMLYDNRIWQYYHQLPETANGAELTQEQARIIVLSTIAQQFNLDQTDIIEISATSAQLPARKDWLFIFSDPTIYPLQMGQARISVAIAGDEVINVARSIYIPEEWERTEQHKQNTLNIFTIVFILLFVLMTFIALYIASKQNKMFFFSKKLFFVLFGIVITLLSIDIMNTWSNVIGALNTSLPLNIQLFQTITGLIVISLIKALFYATLICVILSKKRSTYLSSSAYTFSIGICSGLFLAGIMSAIKFIIPTDKPLWPEYEFFSYSIPLLTHIISSVAHYAQLTMIFSLLFMLIDTASRHYIFLTAFTMLCGMAMVDLPSLEMLGIWIIMGTILGLSMLAIYRYIIRYDYALIPLATGSFTILSIAQQALFNAYPGAMLNNIISGCVVTVFSALWYWYVSKQH